jgi:hypothetical protein
MTDEVVEAQHPQPTCNLPEAQVRCKMQCPAAQRLLANAPRETDSHLRSKWVFGNELTSLHWVFWFEHFDMCAGSKNRGRE